MAAQTIVHFEIPVSDLERMRTFYTECFGWSFQDTGMPGMEYWMISTGPAGKSLGGGMYRRMGPDDRPRNFVGVDDIDRAIERFLSAGGSQIVGKQEVPKMGWSFIGADPEGNVLALWQPMAPMRGPRPPRRKATPARRTPSRKAKARKGRR